MNRYLVVFDRERGKVLTIRNVGNTHAKGIGARLDAEREFRESPAVEVVVLSANSQEDLIQTHSRYFKGIGDLLEDIGKTL